MTDDEAAFQLKALVLNGARISWEKPHARDRALERKVPTFIAERIVQAVATVRVTKASDGSVTWRVSGFDPDQRPIDVVVFPASAAVLRVITVIRTDE